jgi:adenine-specific DNA-methyltransferase
MSKLPTKIQSIQNELNKLSELKNFEQTQRVILSVVKLLDDTISEDDLNLFQLFNDSDGKIRANSTWFYEDQVIADRKATYKVHADNQLNIDFKVYGVNKAKKQVISWATALTPNFEDEPFNSKFNIGIDFIIPRATDRVIIVLTNNYVIRTLELKEDITATYQEILAKWTEIKDFSNKSAVHNALWESFDLQPLNKKFYTGISERFITLRQHLIKEEILDEKHASMFANRLIGRVIFTWFLNKKGIINYDLKYFDSQSFQSDTEYYKTKLERLFFGVLNTPIEEREYKDEVTPFLNGGLFEARENDLYNQNKLSFPKNYFDDLFEFLSAYNFTTDESTSQFQQVAIDPEMLGRIFENLLAEIAEETGEQARKAKGAFYTPREIVDYMCKESLREYLKTKLNEDTYRDQRLYQLIDAPDKDFQDQDHNWRRDWKPYKDAILIALDELKVLDPACGSGAFPIGMLQLLVRVYERLEPRFDGYKAKLQIIERNIYGVDIEPMAVEIARLRTWLSIVVDEESDSRKIKPLPNLEFKFVCANSLIDLDQSGQSVLYGEDPELENKLRDIRDAYFNTESVNKKKKLKSDYEILVNVSEGLFGALSEKTKQLKTYRPFDNESSASFFNPEFMFGIRAYDIVIGNPPYIKEYTNKNAFDGLRKSPYYQGKMDLWYLFSCRFIDLINENGIECFIAQNNWVTSSGASKMRNKVITDTQIISLIDFGDYKIFETAGIQTMIMLFKKSSESEKYNFDYRSIVSNKPIFTDIISILNKTASDNVIILTPEINRRDLIDKKLLFNASNLDSILEKIHTKANFVFDARKEVAQGIVYPQDKLNRANKNILGDGYNVGDGIFTLSKQEKDAIQLTDKELNLIKPSYTTKELFKWYGNKNNQEWTIYTDSSFKNPRKIESYPNIKKHLDKFSAIISSDNQPYGLHRARDEKFFTGNKIIVARKSATPTFTYTDFDSYVSATFNVIKTDRINLKYLTAILNSKVISFWLKCKGKMQGNNYQIDKEPILEIPVFASEESKQKELIKLVDDIISAKKIDMRAEIKDIENQIDEIVMDLYGLTDTEKEVVINSLK